MNNILHSFSMIIVTGLATGCSPGGDSKKGEAPLSGKALYDQHCNVCHGPSGKKGLAGANDLSASTQNRKETLEVITFGRNNMAGFKDVLSEQERAKVTDYVLKLRKGDQ